MLCWFYSTWLLVFPAEQYTFPDQSQGSRYRLLRVEDEKHDNEHMDMNRVPDTTSTTATGFFLAAYARFASSINCSLCLYSSCRFFSSACFCKDALCEKPYTRPKARADQRPT